MAWKVPRGRYGVDALKPEEIQKFLNAPATAANPIARRSGSPQHVNPC